jgi:alkylated DNA repair dioxygenase AlkB
MTDIDENGLAHYRFPVNSQDHHDVFPFHISPTVSKIKEKLVALTGIPYNHAVVLLYRDGKDDCIGFHKDKTLDLSELQQLLQFR